MVGMGSPATVRIRRLPSVSWCSAGRRPGEGELPCGSLTTWLAVTEVVEIKKAKIFPWGLGVTAGFLCTQPKPSILLASVQKRPKHATLLDKISTG